MPLHVTYLMTVPKNELQAEWNFFSFSSLLHFLTDSFSVTDKVLLMLPYESCGHSFINKALLLSVDKLYSTSLSHLMLRIIVIRHCEYT
jgi:hypothetical protein